jgi:hypothetical protein
MKKSIYSIIASLLLTSAAIYASVDTEMTITVGGINHPLRVTVPTSYDALNSYPLIVGLHYCTGTSIQYREALRPLCDSLNVIIVCPDNNMEQMTDPAFILASIDTARNNYNIDSTQVFLTGMSCNGFSLLQMGLNNIYPFKGIFPWAPGFSSFTTTTFNLESEIPVVISVGTLDGNYNTILSLYDSLEAHAANVDLVIVKNIAHVLDFASFDEEMIRCMWYLNDTNAMSIEQVEDFTMLNTDPAREIKVHIENQAGRTMHFRTISSHYNTIPTAGVTVNATNDTATFMLTPIAERTGIVHYVLEATEDGGNGIEQMIFRVNIENPIASGLSSDESHSGIEVYPVPAEGKIYLKCQAENVSLVVVNMEGRTVIRDAQFNTSSELNISSLPAGIYLLKASNEYFEGSARFQVK